MTPRRLTQPEENALKMAVLAYFIGQEERCAQTAAAFRREAQFDRGEAAKSWGGERVLLEAWGFRLSPAGWKALEDNILLYLTAQGDRCARTAAAFTESMKLRVDVRVRTVSDDEFDYPRGAGVLEEYWGYFMNARKMERGWLLFDAIEEGDLDEVELQVLLHVWTGLDVGTRRYEDDGTFFSRRFYPPLCYAARHGQLKIVEYLLELGHDEDGACNDGFTPLMAACRHKHLDVVEFLLDQGCDVGLADNDGCTALHWTARLYTYTTVHNHPAIVRLLVHNGAKVDVPNVKGLTPLLEAVEDDNVAMVKLLVELGADKDHIEDEDLERDYEDGEGTPLCMAAYEGSVEVVKCLVELGADKEKADYNSKTPIFIAAQHGHVAVVRYLVEQGADMERPDRCGWSPLFGAAHNGYYEVVRFLAELGANINKVSGDGRTPLMNACYHGKQDGNEDVVEYLLEQGCDTDLTDYEENTALHLAAEGGCVAVLRLLVEKGMDKDVVNDHGATPLMTAC